MKRAFFLSALAFWAVCAAVSSSVAAASLDLNFRFDSVPDEQRFVGDIVRTRIAERSTGGALTVEFKIDAAAFEPEEFELTSDGASRTASISAGSFPGLIFGSGALLRSLDYRADAFDVPTQTLREKPNAPLRCCYFARHFHNWYHMADAAELDRYVEDLALWGFNAIGTIPVPCINLNLDPDSPEWRESVEGVKQIRSSAKRLGLKFVAMGGSNSVTRDLPPELAATPNVDPKRGNNGFNVCPSKPGGTEFLDRFVRAEFGSFGDEQGDYTVFWPFDEGGCECELCGPWATNGFLKCAERYSRTIRDEFAPDSRFVLSTWTFHEDEFAAAWDWIKDKPEFEYVLADSHTDFPKYPLEHPLPPGHKLITFPEISMWNRFPWGGYGATPLPGRFSDLWAQVRGKVDGCVQYSEGPFEDVNKVTVERFYYKDAPADETLREYARYELVGANPDEFVELCRTLERTHIQQDPPTAQNRADSIAAMKLAVKIDSEIVPGLKNGFRWRQFYCRCLLDYERNVRGTINTRTYADAIRELTTLYHIDRFPAGVVDEMHGCVAPQFPSDEIGDYPRPEEELETLK